MAIALSSRSVKIVTAITTGSMQNYIKQIVIFWCVKHENVF